MKDAPPAPDPVDPPTDAEKLSALFANLVIQQTNLALAFLEPGAIEIVSGVNLPMVIKARALAREGRTPREIAHTLVERGRRAIVAAAELVDGAKGGPHR